MSSFHVTQWEVRGKSRPDGLDLYDIYSQDPTWFTIQLFHGGQFLNLGCPDVRYVNGKENYIDLVDASEFSIYALRQMFRTLGYSDDELVEYWYKTPGLDLEGDFRPILCDNDITTLCGYVESVKLVEIYVHHVGGNSEFVDKENIVEEVVVEMGDNRRSFSNNEQVEEEIESEDSDGFEVDPDGFDSLSDDENDPPLKSTLKKLRKKNAKAIQQSGCPFYLGQSILEKKQIKRLVTAYAVKTRRQLYVLKNDRFRFRVICMGKHPHSCVNVPDETGNLSEGEKCFDGLSDVEICGSHEGESNKEDERALNKEKLPQATCPLVLYFSRKKESELFVVKTLVDQHHCLQTRDVNLYTISFIAREIEPIIQSNPTIPLRALQDQIQRKHQLQVQSMIDKPKTQEYPLTPFVRNQLDEIKKCAAEYNVVMAGGNKYQVSGPWLDQCVVDVQTKTCSCRKWELIGIPCKHAVAVNWNMGSNAMNVGLLESWVSDVYRLSTWQEVYKHTIVPICGVELWTPSNCPTTLLPPKHHIQVGRPKKKRRKTQDEMMSKVPLEGKLTRYGHMKHCSKCKHAGHNSRSCKGQGGQGDGFSGKGGQGHWNGGQAHGFGGQGQGTQTTQPTTQNAPQATQGSQTRYGQRCSKCKGQGHNARSCKF
ncbi:hypothetical protein QVD17_25014 [Tagetes erecta]|uniref:SWIM-type domain-containing protein n=1 Tax=Tagetes erecta TaxID=13708 RepID=A0AAD8KFQ6_TARER|nr:hypothetical protein QVD17_25014 [Tagetes erecta]